MRRVKFVVFLIAREQWRAQLCLDNRLGSPRYLCLTKLSLLLCLVVPKKILHLRFVTKLSWCLCVGSNIWVVFENLFFVGSIYSTTTSKRFFYQYYRNKTYFIDILLKKLFKHKLDYSKLFFFFIKLEFTSYF